MRKTVATLVAAAISSAFAQGAARTERWVTVVSITSPVSPGGVVSLVVRSEPGATCSGGRQTHFSDAFTKELPTKTVGADGLVRWKWHVMPGAHPIGDRRARVTCSIGERSQAVEAVFSVQ